MKTRFGFISNSSSSSFIVSVKKNSKATGIITIVKEVNLSEYASKTIESAEDLYEYFREQYGNKDEWCNELLKSYKLCLKELANDKIILLGDFCDEDEFEERILCEEGLQNLKSDTVKVIQSEGGY